MAQQQSASSSSSGNPTPTDPLAALAHLQQQFMQLQQHVQQQGNQTAQQLAATHQAVQAAAAAQPAASASSVRLPKIAPPPRFKGDMNTVDTFIRAIDQQCEYYGISGGAKLQFAFAHLDHGALMWFNALDIKPTTWIAFTDQLYARFRPVEVAMMARQRLDTLRQRNNTVSAYVNAFQTILTPISDMSQADQVHHFVMGLTPSLVQRVWEKRPKTLASAIEFAASVEAGLVFAGRSASHYQGSRSHTSASSSSDSIPMDINHVSHDGLDEELPMARFHDEPQVDSTALLSKVQELEHRLAMMQNSSIKSFSKDKDRISGLKSGDISRLMKEGKCFRCQKTGHMKSECPQAKHVSFSSKSKSSNY